MVDAVIAYACSEVDTPASWSVPDNAIVFRVSSAVEVKLVQPLLNPYSLQLQCPSRTDLPYGTGAIVADRVHVDHVPERLDLWCVVLPESAVEYPLLARTFADGDRLTPIGLGRSKKLGDCFADRKVSREDRYRTPIIADAKGILWVPGVVADERIRVCNVPCICIRLRLDRGVRTPTV